MNYTSWLYMISVNYTTSLSATVLSCTIPFDWYSILFMDDTSRFFPHLAPPQKPGLQKALIFGTVKSGC